MRWINLIIAVLMLLFIAVQFNDVDGLWWMFIYSIPMVWALLAALRPSWLLRSGLGTILGGSILLAFIATLYYWPKSAGWWKKDVWWEVESAREGMGLMIVCIALLVVWWTRRRLVPRQAVLTE